jgi:hypothetical protein
MTLVTIPLDTLTFVVVNRDFALYEYLHATGQIPGGTHIILSRLGDTRAGLASLFLHAYANQTSSCSTPVCIHGGVDFIVPSVYSCALTFSARSYATHVLQLVLYVRPGHTYGVLLQWHM